MDSEKLQSLVKRHEQIKREADKLTQEDTKKLIVKFDELKNIVEEGNRGLKKILQNG